VRSKPAPADRHKLRRPRTSRQPLVCCVLPLIAILVACARQAPATLGSEPEPAAQVDSIITIRVVNHSQLDAIVYLAHDGARDRLGAVTAATNTSFPVRTRILTSGDFALIVDPVGSLRTATSERLLLRLGSLFIWTLESDFAHNSVQVQE
jgi:hypothetical protein